MPLRSSARCARTTLHHHGRLVALLAAVALFPISARAVYIVSPGFPTIDPTLAADHAFVRTQYSISPYVYSAYADSVGSGSSGSQTYPADKNTIVSQPIVSTEASANLGPAFDNEQTVATGSVFGTAGGGVLKVYAQAYAHAGVARSDVAMGMDIIDKMTVENGGTPNIGVDITGTPERQYQDSSDYANSWGSVDVYVWSTSQGVPLKGQSFQPAYHTHYQINWDGTTNYTETDPTAVFSAGSTWYYAASVQANAVANISDGPFYLSPTYPTFQATADFSHSFDLHIGADPSTPDFSFTMASGISYAAPEPASLLLLLPAGLLLGRGRRAPRLMT